jgi:phospholipid transport system substrate-binding protein
MNSKSLIKIITEIFCYLILINVSIAAPVQENIAKDWVNDTGRKLIDTLSNSNIEEKYMGLENIFNEDIDTNYMARFVIGKYWRLMNDEQQERYLSLFDRYAISLYKNYPLNFDTTGLDFEVVSVNQNQKFTDVTCSITLPEQFATETMKNINVKFKLSQENNKTKIVDLILGQSSLLQTYRNRFYNNIKELDEEMEWFLEDFHDMVLSSEKTAQEKFDSY